MLKSGMGQGFQGAPAGTSLLQNILKLTTLGPSTSLLKGNLAKININNSDHHIMI